jgi:phage/plasmid-like protein (TIGR03299 family)
VTDVNTAFDTERTAQLTEVTEFNARATELNATRGQRADIDFAAAASRFEQRVANGTMKNLGGGRYEVNEPGSWDNGEIFNVQRRVDGLRELLVMPEHGLDVSTGETAFYGRVPEWHDKGTIIPTGLSSIPAVLTAARINFKVKQRPAGGWGPVQAEEGATLVGSQFYPEEGKFQNYRDDTLAGLGIVGKIFTPIQPAESMAFLQGLVNDGSVIVESAGALDGGKRIFISCLLPTDMVVDADGIADHVQLYVVVFDRFDGQGQFQAVVTPWRPRCKNTERLGLANAVTRWGIRHTTNAHTRVEEAQKTLRLSSQYAEQFTEEETLLARTAIAAGEFDALIAELWPRDKNEETKRSATVADKREAQLHQVFEQEVDAVGRTAYAAERAVTGWLDNVAPRRVVGDKLAAARATASFIGTDDDTKTAAHARLMQRVR